jgi:glycosyltransferase involved in cell wall biosynthesis
MQKNIYNGRWISEEFVPGLVSVIIPTYNRQKYIIETMNSVWNQTYRPIEMIVVDDGSTDNTKEFVEQFREKTKDDKNFELRYFYQANKSAPTARNLGLMESKGEFIQFIDSDDLIHPQKISRQVAVLHKCESMTAVYGDYILFAQDRKNIKVFSKVSIPRNDITIRAWLSGKYLVPHSILWSRNDINNFGIWDESLSRNQDGEYAIRFLTKEGNFVYVNQAISYYRQYYDNTPRIVNDASNEALLSLYKVLEKIEKYIIFEKKECDYQNELACSFYELAEDAVLTNTELSKHCIDKFKRYTISKNVPGTWEVKILRKILGIKMKKKLCLFLRYRLGMQPFKHDTVVNSINELYNLDIMK